MIFTTDFINVLTLFKNINNGMYFREGNIQSTIGINSAKAMTFFARAFTDVNIEKCFAISDLGKLLGVLRMFSAPEIILEDRCLVISDTNKHATFTLSQPEFISYKKNPDKVEITDGYEAALTSEHISDIVTFSNLFNAENISFNGSEGKFQVIISSKSNSSSDEGIIDLGKIDDEFSAVILATSFRIDNKKNNKNYKLLVNKKGIVYIGNENIEYYIPTDAKLSKWS